MPNVYSELLFEQSGLGGVSESIGPDLGKVWIVRDIDVYTSAFVTAELFAVSDSSGGAFFWAFAQLGDKAWIPWRGRQIFPPLSSFHFNVTSGNWDVRVSGYVLSTP